MLALVSAVRALSRLYSGSRGSRILAAGGQVTTGRAVVGEGSVHQTSPRGRASRRSTVIDKVIDVNMNPGLHLEMALRVWAMRSAPLNTQA